MKTNKNSDTMAEDIEERYEQVKPYLYSYAKKYRDTNPEFQIHELANEAWMKVCKINNPKFISICVKRAILGYIRAQHTQRRRGNPAITVITSSEMSRRDAARSTSYRDKDKEQVAFLMSKLTPEEQALIRQYYLEGMTQEEMAVSYGTSRQNICTYLFKIRKKLKLQI